MSTLKAIHWNQAIEEQKEIRKEKEQQNEGYQENLKLARNEFNERLHSKRGVTFMDLEDACAMYSVDQEDLENLLL